MDYTQYDTRLAAYCVITDADRVLLAKWNESEHGKWTLPGGGVELDETPEQGAIREVKEETGFDVELTGLLGVHTYVVPSQRRLSRSRGSRRRPMKAVRVVYGAEITGGVLTKEIGGSTDEARWFDLSRVPDLPQVGLVEIGLAMWDRERTGA